MSYKKAISGYRIKASAGVHGCAVKELNEQKRALGDLPDYFADLPIDTLRASWVAAIMAAVTEGDESIDAGCLNMCLIVVKARL